MLMAISLWKKKDFLSLYEGRITDLGKSF